MLRVQDGSSESFKELLEGIMSPSTLMDFDTNIFQAALVGKRDVLRVACVLVLALQADHYANAALSCCYPELSCKREACETQ